MSLPPGFLDELRTRSSLATVAGRKLTWDARKTNPGKGDYWAPCPFHQEKTASFHLDDRKGFYYCFGCHAKGDAVTFIRETENVGFMEAVEILAREVGMTMPARDPQAKKKADRRSLLVDIMEQAVQFYRLQLNTSGAGPSRDYLANRGLSASTQDRFDLGYAPNSRTSLFQHLTGKGAAADLIVEAGLAIKPDDGGAPFDRFRNRIMFPIRDARSRAIAFGARAMDPNARAKYLNSPETPLFDKGRNLYNLAPAREAAGKASSLIVAEGYMDVIALVEAGFDHAVAPLGTAITETQLQLMWRLCPEPVIALDGDKAGLRAAIRLIDLALPLLKPGQSLHFALLPEGLDPDEVIRSQGRRAMSALLSDARPLVDLLWQRETDGRVFDTPERRAALDASLRTALEKIRDTSVRNHYTAAIKGLRAEIFGLKKRSRGEFWRPTTDRPTNATSDAKNSMLAQGSGDWRTEERLRETMILAACLNHPEIVIDFESALERLGFTTANYGSIRDAILHEAPLCQGDANVLLANVENIVGAQTLEKLSAHRHLRAVKTIRKDTSNEVARTALAEELAKLEAERGARSEIEDAMQDIAGLVDEGLTWRLSQATDAQHKAARSSLETGGKDREDHKKLSKDLQNLIDGEVWVKKKH